MVSLICSSLYGFCINEHILSNTLNYEINVETMNSSLQMINSVTKFFVSISVFSLAFTISTIFLWASLDKINDTPTVASSKYSNFASESTHSDMIDVVYTWVNGSDPQFLEELEQTKQRYLNHLDPEYYHKNCQECPNPSEYLVLESDFVFTNFSINECRLLMKKNYPHLKRIQNEQQIHSKDSLDCDAGCCQPIYAAINCSNNQPFVDEEIAQLIESNQVVLIVSLDGLNIKKFTHFKLRNVFDFEVKYSYDNSETISLITVDPDGHYEPEFIDEKVVQVLKNFPNITVTWPVPLLIEKEPLCSLKSTKNLKSMSRNRFADHNELMYSLRSIEKYAPWIRNIFLVTNGQVPNWLDVNHPKIHLVNHSTIFPNKNHLPTFNSLAIESHLYEIPGLSDDFIYLNDDMLFSKAAFPDDFYNKREGYKVRLSYAVPNCSPNCPSPWLSDGYCDRACNTTLCLYDGGDCLGDGHALHESDVNNFQFSFEKSSDEIDAINNCSPGCLDHWLADQTCDSTCQNKECAFDMGDCGYDSFQSLPHLNSLQNETLYYLPTTSAFYFDISNFSYCPLWQIQTAGFERHEKIRRITLNLKYQVIFALLKSNLSFSLPLEFEFECNTGHEVKKIRTQLLLLHDPSKYSQNNNQNISSTFSPLKPLQNSTNNHDVDPHPLFLLDDEKSSIVAGVNVCQASSCENGTQNNASETMKKIAESNIWLKKPAFKYEKDRVLRDIGKFIALKEGKLKDDNFKTRHLLDAHIDSIIYSNYLYNKVFGIFSRRVPAHGFYFFNKQIMNRLWEKFPQEMEATSSHRFRSGKDMSIVFAYSYFLMSETVTIASDRFISKFDTDKSGSLNYIEFRAFLLTLPENDSISISSEQATFNWTSCPESQGLFSENLISLEKILTCNVLLELIGAVNNVKKNSFTALDARDVQFIMVRPNLTLLMRDLDAAMQKPTQMICFNDDIDDGEANEISKVRATLKSFYEYNFPHKSSFELDFTSKPPKKSPKHSEIKYFDTFFILLMILLLLIILISLQFNCCFYSRRRFFSLKFGKKKSANCRSHQKSFRV